MKQVPRWSARQTKVASQLYTDHDKKSPDALPSSRRLLAFWGERRGAAVSAVAEWPLTALSGSPVAKSRASGLRRLQSFRIPRSSGQVDP